MIAHLDRQEWSSLPAGLIVVYQTGINKTETAGAAHVQIRFSNALRRVFPTRLTSTRISWPDLPGDLVRPKFSNI